MVVADGACRHPCGRATNRMQGPSSRAAPTIVPRIDPDAWTALRLAPGVLAPFATVAAHGLVAAALTATDGSDVRVSLARVDTTIVGAVVSASSSGDPGARTLLAVGVTGSRRREGIATLLLREHLADSGPGSRWEAMVGLGERDAASPEDATTRFATALALLEGAGFSVKRMEASNAPGSILALLATRG